MSKKLREELDYVIRQEVYNIADGDLDDVIDAILKLVERPAVVGEQGTYEVQFCPFCGNEIPHDGYYRYHCEKCDITFTDMMFKYIYKMLLEEESSYTQRIWSAHDKRMKDGVRMIRE